MIHTFFGTVKEQPWNQYANLKLKRHEMQKLTPEAIKCANDVENGVNNTRNTT